MAVDKLERLMNLIAALLHTRVPLSAAELQTRVGGYPPEADAFRRQFSRDKKDLREMGVPIRVEMVPDADPPLEGYRIEPDDYYLPDPHLDADELAALHLATRLIAVGPESAPRGLFKLGGMAISPAGDAPPWASVPSDQNLGVVFDAIHRRRSVEFGYRGRARRLAPRALGFRNGHWYVNGVDLELDAERVYRLDRIDGEVHAGDAVSAPLDGSDEVGSLQPWHVGGDDVRTATILVDPVAVPTVTAQLGPATPVTVRDDGSAEVTLEVTNSDGFRTWLLGLGPTVEVIGPADIRDDIVAWLDRIVGADA